MAAWQLPILALFAVATIAASRQPVTAKGAVESAEKLSPGVTPVAKVLELLKDLTTKVEDEGKREAASYDKYACFCKEQVDEKTYAIERSEKKVKKLTAKLEDLNAKIQDLLNDIANLNTKITDAESAIATLDTDRAAEHDSYLQADAEIVAAIDACGRAIEALKESKASMEGKTKLEDALAQVHAVASKGFVVLTAEQAQALSDLAKGGAERKKAALSAIHQEPGDAYESTYHSNNITATLESLLQIFTDEKNAHDKDEFTKKSIYDENRMHQVNIKDFAKKELAEKSKHHAEKSAEAEQTTEDKNRETTELTMDSEFLEVLRKECEQKATEWDQRSQTRAQELKALADATEALKSGVAPNWEANRRLNDLQTRKATKSPQAAASFLQLRGAHERDGTMAAAKALRVLDGAAARLSSAVLSMASLRIRASTTQPVDHFVGVRSIISDLIKRLREDELAEAGQKAFCDEQVGLSVSDRDSSQAEKEKSDATIAVKTSHTKDLTLAIASLSADIASGHKALLEATELRQAEQIDNEDVVAKAKDGIEAVKLAIGFLKDFYNPAFVQRSGYIPPNADRSGNTVGDLAPETFDGEYTGQEDASKGIIGLLEVILSDFERTESTIAKEEQEAQSSFETFKQETENEVTASEALKVTTEGELTNTKDELVVHEGELSIQKEDYDLSIDQLDKLRAMCVDKSETFEQRAEKREQEIEALKEAHAILEDWESQ